MRTIATALLWAVFAPVFLTQSAFGAGKVIEAPVSDQSTSLRQPTASLPVFEDIRPVGQPISLGVNAGTLLHLPSAAHTVFVGDPDVADVQIKDPGFIYVFGKKPGETVLYAQDNAGHILLKSVITIGGPVTIIRRATIGVGGQPTPPPTINQFQIAPPAATAVSPVAESR